MNRLLQSKQSTVASDRTYRKEIGKVRHMLPWCSTFTKCVTMLVAVSKRSSAV